MQVLQSHKSAVFLFVLTTLAHYAYSQQKPQTASGVMLAKSGRAFTAVAWSSDGKYFASAWNTSVLIWDSGNNTIAAVCGGHTERITSISFSGNYMLTSSDDGSVIIYNLRNDYSAIRIPSLPKKPGEKKNVRVKSVALSSDGGALYFSQDGRSVSEFLHLIFTDDINIVTYTYSGHDADIYSVQIGKSKRIMLTTAEDGTSILWDTREHRQIQSFDVYAKSKVPAVLAPDENTFLSMTAASTITLRAFDGTEHLVIQEPLRPVNSVAFTADGSHFALALQNGDIAMYNAHTGEAERIFSTRHGKKRGVVCSLAFSPDGEFIVAGTADGCLFMWSINGKPIAETASPYSDSKIQDAILNLSEEKPEQEYAPKKDEQSPIVADDGQGADNAASAQGRNAQAQTRAAAPLPAAPQTSPIPRHQLSVLAGVSSQPSDYFTPSIELAVEYRSFAFYPLYFGGAIALGDALPSKDYPFTYQNAGQPMRQPSMYRLGAQAIAGIAYYFERIQVTAIMEARAGMSARILWNTQFKPSATTTVYPSATAGLGIGFLWHGVTGRFGVDWDSKFDFLYSGYIGYSFALGRKSK